MQPIQQQRRALLLSSLAALALPAAAHENIEAVGTTFARIFEPDGAGARGLAVDLLRRCFSEPLRLAFLPYPRAQIEVEQGDADVLVGPYRTPEREARFLFSQRPFYEDAMVFYTRHGSAAGWDGQFPRLAELEVGAVKGWAYGAGFEAMRLYMKRLTLVTEVSRGLLMLKLERLDLFASNERNTQPVLEQLKLGDQVLRIGPPLDLMRGHFAFPRTPRGQQLRQRYDQGFEQLLRSGEFARLAQLWGVRVPA
jgi:polar amino acid transport system substrate-binding protein